MTTNMIWVVTAIYAATALQFAWDRNVPMFIVFSGYAAANVGIVMSLK